MSALALKLRASRLPRRRALAPLLAGGLGAVAAVALLTPSGGGHRRELRSIPAIPAPIAHPTPGTCAASAMHAAKSKLGAVLDATLRRTRADIRAPAATAAVVVCGHVVWADATGVLDLASRRHASNRSLFVLNSAAKTFVATMVMQEIQDGHLSLDTRLSRFYPWLPNARQISVRMLLNMTSGLPDYLYNPRIEWVMQHQPRHHWTVDQVLTGLGAGLGAPKFSPGREFQYSDTNYIVLGAILERITHSSIQRDFQQLIARPLGITSATFVPNPAAKALIAHPYVRSRDGSLTSRWIPGFGVSTAVWGPVFTDGGLASSSLDVARFANALIGGQLVPATAVRQMTQIGRGNYGFGFRDRSFDGHFWLGHRGYFDGFEAEDWSDPSRQVTIAVATNLQTAEGGPTSTRIWLAIARAYDGF